MAKNTFATFGILAVLLMSLGMVSAAVEGVSMTIKTNLPNPVTLDNSYNVEVTVANANGTTILLEWVNLSSSYNTIWTNLEDNSTIDDSDSADSSATLYVPSDYTGAHLRYLKANVYDNVTGDLLGTIQKGFMANFTATEEVPGCTDSSANNYDSSATTDDGSCTYGEEETACYFEHNVNDSGDLEIVDVDVNNNGKGDDDVWEYMDAIEIEVDVENTDDDSIRNVEVQVIIMFEDDDGNWTDVTKDFNLDDDIITSIGKLQDGDEESVIFTLEVPADVDVGDYRLYIIAYSEGKEGEQCISKYDDFTGDLYYEFDVEDVEYEDSIIVGESDLGVSLDTYCGANNFEIVIPVYNLYSEDEERVLVKIYNSELGIDKSLTIDDLNDGRSEDVIFYVSIPQYLDKEKYDLKITVYFYWDDEEDEYDVISYEESNTASLRLNVLGCVGPSPSIKPSLDSVSQKGSELIVKTLITNNGDGDDFLISISGYESWARLVSITPDASYVAKGEFVEATVVLMPTITGMHSFKIVTTVDGETYTQPVSVNIKDNLEFLGLEGTTLYLVAGITAVLLLIFLVLLVKVVRSKPVKAQF